MKKNNKVSHIIFHLTKSEGVYLLTWCIHFSWQVFHMFVSIRSTLTCTPWNCYNYIYWLIRCVYIEDSLLFFFFLSPSPLLFIAPDPDPLLVPLVHSLSSIIPVNWIWCNIWIFPLLVIGDALLNMTEISIHELQYQLWI